MRRGFVQYYKYNNAIYILTQLGTSSPSVALVNITNGITWSSVHEVKDTTNISDEVWEDMVEEIPFKLIAENFEEFENYEILNG